MGIIRGFLNTIKVVSQAKGCTLQVKFAGFGHFGQNGHSGQSGFTLNVNGGAGKENWLSRQRVKFAQFAIDKMRPAYSLPIVPPIFRKERPGRE